MKEEKMSGLDPKTVEEALEWLEADWAGGKPRQIARIHRIAAAVLRDWLRVGSIPDDMVERAAIAEWRLEGGQGEWADQNEDMKDDYRESAATCLSAALSPSEEE